MTVNSIKDSTQDNTANNNTSNDNTSNNTSNNASNNTSTSSGSSGSSETTNSSSSNTVTTAKSDNSDVLVWISDNGTKYHSKSSCSGMKNNVRQVTLEVAKTVYNRTACGKCHPPLKKNLAWLMANGISSRPVRVRVSHGSFPCYILLQFYFRFPLTRKCPVHF